MNRTHRHRTASQIIVASAVLALAAGCAAPSQTTAPPASRSTSAEPAAEGCLRDDGGCLGVLAPGTYASEQFTISGESSPGQLTYTVADGYWANALDHSPAYWFQPADPYAAGTGDDFLPGVYVWADIAGALQEFPACPEEADPSAPTDAAGLIAWISALPGVTTASLTEAAIGDLSVAGIELELDPDTAPSCSWGPFVPLIAGRAGAEDAYMWGISGGERMHFYPLDLGGGHTAAVIIDAPAADFDALLPHAQQLIATLTFVTP
ncbi:hypothetical protein ACFM35_00150 [Microbacterium sp. P01]|uniref:hypothetical protein n=1 Tax=unclassified Microbacterium TaxID=2609290 RepID=UPI00366FF569